MYTKKVKGIRDYINYLHQRSFLGNKEVYDIEENEILWCRAMLKEVSKIKLDDINLYHYLTGKLSFSKFKAYKEMTTVQAQVYLRAKLNRIIIKLTQKEIENYHKYPFESFPK